MEHFWCQKFKVTKPAFLMFFFAPGLMFADCSALTCFHQIKIENNSILAQIPPLGAFFPDLIFTSLQ